MKKILPVIIAYFIPLAALAKYAAEPITPPTGGINIADMIKNIINFIFGFAALLAVLFLIIGGIWYVTSAGNPDRVKKGRQTLLYSVIGLIVIVLSYFIVSLVIVLANRFV